jgi:hypothetical protein
MKRNKLRYQSHQKPRIAIILSGEIYLRHRDEEQIHAASKGDIMLHPYNDALNNNALGEYEATGFSGYFKVDVCDGKQWCALLSQPFFPENEHHFSKKERPIDTFELCAGMLRAFAGRAVVRTYREHYTLEEPLE